MSIMRMRNGISIHALREEGDEPIDHCTHAAGISIHALREEGDRSSGSNLTFSQRFLSTPSARRATFDPGAMFRLFRFLSTPSARRATNQSTTALTPLVFLSTPSARRATSVLWAMTNWHRYFYPRPPRGGRRRGNGGTACGSKNFYPRPPRGGRRARWNPLVLIPVFLSTPSARRATKSSYWRR